MHDLILFAILLFVIAIIALFVRAVFAKKETPTAAAEEVEADFVDDAKVAESRLGTLEEGAVFDFSKIKTDASNVIHKLDADVVAELHKAEAATILKPGTTQAYVEAHTVAVQVDAVAKSDALNKA